MKNYNPLVEDFAWTLKNFKKRFEVFSNLPKENFGKLKILLLIHIGRLRKLYIFLIKLVMVIVTMLMILLKK